MKGDMDNPTFISDTGSKFTSNDLIEVRDLIKDPEDWASKSYFKLEKRRRGGFLGFFGMTYQHATYCAVGAINHIHIEASEKANAIENYLWNVAAEMGFSGGIMSINDHIGHAAVMAVMQRGIERKQAEEKHFEVEQAHINELHGKLRDQLTLNDLDFESDITHEEIREILHK